MRWRRPRWWVSALLALAAAPIVAIAALNVLVAVALPALLGARPERTRVDYGMAWMLWPGVLEVRDLRIRSQSQTDQWTLEADRARATIDLRALRERRFVASDLTGDGVSFRYRLRTEGTPDPADLYPPGDPWPIDLDGFTLTGLRELWIEDYRYLGDGRATGDFSLRGPGRFEVKDVVLVLEGGDLTLGPDLVASDVRGVVEVSIAARGDAPLVDLLDAHAALTAEVEDLRFVDEYLRGADWLSLRGGRGGIVADASVAGGEFLPGSRMRIDAHGIHARLFSYSALGDGEVTAEIVEEHGEPRSRIHVGFRDFTLVRGDDPRPLVQGEGLEVFARSPDVKLDRPFARVDVTLVIPESTVPDLAVYNAYLPSKLGLGLDGGTGTIRGELAGSTESNRGSGVIFLTGSGVRATYADLALTGDFEVVGRVLEARMDDWHFDLAGSSAQLRNVTIRGKRKEDDSHAWWAAISLPSGSVSMEAPVFFDADMDVRFRDSVPFVTMFSERKPLPSWVRGLLAIEDVSGRTRLRMGDDHLHVDRLELAGQTFEVRMQLRRQKVLSRGILFVRLGQLSLGVRMHGKESDLHLFNARRWYDGQPAPTL